MNTRLPIFFCLGLGLLAAYMSFGPAILHPETTLIGGWDHPDSLSNHWLLVWMSERILQGESILHNDQYYVPIGDAPWLAGNGSTGFWMAPFIWVFGWPKAVPFGMMTLYGMIALAIYAMSRSLNIDRWVASVPVSMGVFLPYIAQELSAARFSQVDVLWLCLSCASFWKMLQAPRWRWVVTTAICVAITAIMYWYYAWFFVLIAVLSTLFFALVQPEVPYKSILKSGLLSLVLILPYAWLFASHWSSIPGTDELTFPSPEAIQDSLSVLPVAFVGPDSLTLPVLGLGLAGVGILEGMRLPNRWSVLMLLSVAVLFGGLSFGVNTSLFEYLYGLLPPLQRFWWPSRHRLVWGLALALLAGFGLQALSWRLPEPLRPICGPLVSFLIPFSLVLQGQPISVVTTPLSGPPEPYTQMDELPEGGVLQLPLNSSISRSQGAMYFQMYHHRSMLNGHAQWVDRVRPVEWDRQIESNVFLSGLFDYERSTSEPVIQCSMREIQELRSWGIRYIILDPALYPKDLRSMLRGLREGLTTLFGSPVLRHDAVLIWDIQKWTKLKKIKLTSWEWPERLVPGDGSQPIRGPMGPNPYLRD